MLFVMFRHWPVISNRYVNCVMLLLCMPSARNFTEHAVFASTSNWRRRSLLRCQTQTSMPSARTIRQDAASSSQDLYNVCPKQAVTVLERGILKLSLLLVVYSLPFAT